MSGASNVLTLTRRRWYAMQLYGQEFSPSSGEAFSPIRVDDVRALGTGKGLLDLTFLHENYPSGVQGKTYRLQVLARDRFLFARRISEGGVRFLMIEELTWRWLQMHFGISPTEAEIATADVQRWKDWSPYMF